MTISIRKLKKSISFVKALRPTFRLLSLSKTYLRKVGKQASIGFSISGTAWEQFSLWQPEVCEHVKMLAETGQVEFLAETYYDSLAFEYSRPEFLRQIELHKAQVLAPLEVEARIFKNTALLYHNPLAYYLKQQGYAGIITEAVPAVFNGKSNEVVYRPSHMKDFYLILRDSQLSDELEFGQFHPINDDNSPRPEGFLERLNSLNQNKVCLSLDLYRLGLQINQNQGFGNFLLNLPDYLKKHDWALRSPSEMLAQVDHSMEFDVPHPVTWMGKEKNLDFWKGNPRQKEALRKIYELESTVRSLKNPHLLDAWSRLQSSDHFLHMYDQVFALRGQGSKPYPFSSPLEAYAYFMNVIADLQLQLSKA